MLNAGIQTREITLNDWVLDPDVADIDVVRAMELRRGFSLEALLVDEMAATDCYHRPWSELCGIDTAELFLRNSATKRVLYLSAPIFLPDTLPKADLIATGVNTRIHIYKAPEPRDYIRLEAVSSYESAGLRFRYALSIQYADDAVGDGWQIIRPVIILDSGLLAAVRGEAGRALLARTLTELRRLILCGSHDYVHATVLNWFPPPGGLPAEYAAILSERSHPPEIEQWHQGTQLPLPDGLIPGKPSPGIATLELYSLQIHQRTMARIAEQAELAPEVARIWTCFGTALADFTREGLRPGTPASLADAVPRYFHTLAGWFLLSAFPLGSPLLRQVSALARPASDDTGPAMAELAAFHGGMFEAAAVCSRDKFPWHGGFVGVDEVTSQYATALRGPAVSGYAAYLSARRPGAGRSWAEALARPELAELLAGLGGCDDGATRRAALRRLRDRGGLRLLGQLGEWPASGHGGAAGHASASAAERYARAVAAGLAALAGAELTSAA